MKADVRRAAFWLVVLGFTALCWWLTLKAVL